MSISEGQTKVKGGSFAWLCRVLHNNIRSLCFVMIYDIWHIMWVWLYTESRNEALLHLGLFWVECTFLLCHFYILLWYVCMKYAHKWWVQKGHQRKEKPYEYSMSRRILGGLLITTTKNHKKQKDGIIVCGWGALLARACFQALMPIRMHWFLGISSIQCLCRLSLFFLRILGILGS